MAITATELCIDGGEFGKNINMPYFMFSFYTKRYSLRLLDIKNNFPVMGILVPTLSIIANIFK